MKEYIEREAVLNDIGELFTICYETLPNDCGHHFIVEKELETHLEFVKELPAADVAPIRRGRWKPFDLSYGRSVYYCTACNHSAVVPTVLDEPIFNFCPNCGAEMKGEAE